MTVILCCLAAASWKSKSVGSQQSMSTGRHWDARGSHMTTLGVDHLTGSHSSLRLRHRVPRVPSGPLKVSHVLAL